MIFPLLLLRILTLFISFLQMHICMCDVSKYTVSELFLRKQVFMSEILSRVMVQENYHIPFALADQLHHSIEEFVLLTRNLDLEFHSLFSFNLGKNG